MKPPDAPRLTELGASAPRSRRSTPVWKSAIVSNAPAVEIAGREIGEDVPVGAARQAVRAAAADEQVAAAAAGKIVGAAAAEQGVEAGAAVDEAALDAAPPVEQVVLAAERHHALDQAGIADRILVDSALDGAGPAAAGAVVEHVHAEVHVPVALDIAAVDDVDAGDPAGRRGVAEHGDVGDDRAAVDHVREGIMIAAVAEEGEAVGIVGGIARDRLDGAAVDDDDARALRAPDADDAGDVEPPRAFGVDRARIVERGAAGAERRAPGLQGRDRLDPAAVHDPEGAGAGRLRVVDGIDALGHGPDRAVIDDRAVDPVGADRLIGGRAGMGLDQAVIDELAGPAREALDREGGGAVLARRLAADRAVIGEHVVLVRTRHQRRGDGRGDIILVLRADDRIADEADRLGAVDDRRDLARVGPPGSVAERDRLAVEAGMKLAQK